MAVSPPVAASLSFVGGVALGAWLPQEATAWGWAALVALTGWGASLSAGRWRAGTRLGLVAFALAGIFRCQSDLAPLYSGGAAVAEGEAVVAGRVGRPAELRDGETVLHLDDPRLRRAGGTVRLSQPLQVVVAGPAAFGLGDLLVARGRLREIRGDRNLGWFPGVVAPTGRRYAARLAVASPAWVVLAGSAPGAGPGATVLRWRAAADAFWKRRPGAAGAILNALTTGERAGLPGAVQEHFLRAGLTHLLAISGMNVGFLAAVTYLLLRRLLALVEPLALRFAVQPLAALLTLPALWFFLLFSGGQLPVGRAVLMCGVAFLAVALWRRASPAGACAVAALAVVARDPRALFSASFQLSFAAVVALFLVAPRLPGPAADGVGQRWGRLRRGARSLLLVSLAASAATAPLVAFHFQQLSLVGPVANLFAVPFTGFVVLPAAWLSLGAAAVSPAAGDAVSRAALAGAGLLVDLAAWFAGPGWAVLRTARPPLLAAGALLLVALLCLPPATRGLERSRAWACAGAAAACTIWALGAARGTLRIAVLDVGQGLSVAVLAPGGRSLLYDAGPRWPSYDAGERVVAPALRRLGVWKLDALAISHPHPDHAGGAASVQRLVGARLVARGWDPNGGAAVAGALRGSGVSVRVLDPRGAVAAARGGDANDGSLALLVATPDGGVVLTGDAGPRRVPAIVAAAAGAADRLLLQAPHHGGSPEACRALAEALRPALAVIPVGRNTYGHPRAGAVAALEARARVLRTDRDGAVLALVRAGGFAVRSWRELAAGRSWGERVRWLVAGW